MRVQALIVIAAVSFIAAVMIYAVVLGLWWW